MEEHVGQWWDRIVTRLARRDYPAAAVALADIERPAAVLFRALGGDGALKLASASAEAHGARRNWRERLAGIGERVELAWRDNEALYLPERIAVFPQPALNRELYLWLAALAAADDGSRGDWFRHNRELSRMLLARCPGLRPRYARLVAAHLQLRPDPAHLPDDEAAQERAIRAALQDPDTVSRWSQARRAPHPVPLWLRPHPPRASARAGGDDGADGSPGASRPGSRDRKRRQARSVDMPKGKDGLLLYRAEAIFALGEYVRARRGTEDEEDPSGVRAAADDLDALSIARDAAPAASRVRFDLDLPSAANDDAPLGAGVPLPEWDWRQRALRPDYCRLQPLIAAQAAPCALPQRLRASARRLRRQFEALAPARLWRGGASDGLEPDLEALIRHRADRMRRQVVAEPNVYRELTRGRRDLACLLLADLSLSTDTWVGNEARVIDVIRDTLFLFAEALAATGDRFALHGFSSRKRSHVRFHHLKGFDEAYGGAVRGRIAAIKPGFYTRMGAAVRHATNLLGRERAHSRLLLLLTDGKPNDLDHYEGRYGIEDTRHAIVTARRQGLMPFCVTIDDEGAEYLPHVFGAGHFVVIRRPQDLPRELPQLYARLTRPG